MLALDKGIFRYTVPITCTTPVGVSYKLAVEKFNVTVGPLAIYKCISPNQFLLMSLDGILYPVIVEEARLKPGLVATQKGPVRNMLELKKAAQLTYANNNNMFLCIQT